jgi:NET1-associated nuclear protein 1 (U3 small nucleolar RNA-associated protein 17)
LDDEAQLRAVAETTDTEAMTIAQPLEDMGLAVMDNAVNEIKEGPMILASDDGYPSDNEEQGEQDQVMDSDLDDTSHHAVINQQRLTEIFDAAPAFAMPPIEDLFYQVVRLLTPQKSRSTAV